MNPDYRILPVERPTDEMWEVIGGGINQYNQQHGGPQGFQHLCFALYTPDGKVAGGLIGEIYWGWFYINLLFVIEELRGQGYGHQLLTQAEEEARKRGATNAFFDTFSFQAPEFYKRHGYRVFGELKDFPPGHARYYMTKQLLQAEIPSEKSTGQCHPYHHAIDYQRVSAFLIAHHRLGNRDGNWLEPAWEYMHFHPALEDACLDKIGVWEDGGEIVAVAHPEWRLGEAFFQFHPAYRHLRGEMLDYAEANLTGISERDGRRYLCAYVNDDDGEFLALVQARGYEKDPEGTRPLYRFDIPDPFPAIPLADGFCLTSLAEEPDWAKVHRVMWRGFDHGDDPPTSDEELESRRRMFDTPKARRDLKIAVAAPDGEFVAFCGMFYEPAHRFAYVEPVATDPAYRRLGLGRAAVLEGIRRCAAMGATVAYVGSDQAFYGAIGFKKVYNSECWVKRFEGV